MPGVDDLMMRIYATMAEKERELISERKRAALAAAKARGAVLGGRLGQHGTELGMVEMPLAGATAQQRALETEVANGALELTGRLRIGGGQGGEALEAIGAAGACLRDEVVYEASRRDGGNGFKVVQPGRCERQNLHIHALLVHQRQAAFAKVRQSGAVLAAIRRG